MNTNTSTFYQIYTLGFCGAPQNNDGKYEPRIRKLIEWTDYFKESGFDTLLLNPVFESDSHGYDTRNYGLIDQRLGSNKDFAKVCAHLHSHGIRVILDGVFNHVGRGFWAFQDVLNNRENSSYKDWFFIRFDQNNGYNDGLSYEGWEGHYELVKLNLRNPEVVAHIFYNIRAWIDQFGIDGLRLDVAYCLDQDFLRQLHSFVKSIDPEFFLVGEILFGDYRQIVNGEMLDSCTNYECYKGIYSSLNDRNLFEINYSLTRQFAPNEGMYRDHTLLSFVDNHDVDRIASSLSSADELPLAYGLLFGMPGIPCVYYGSEWGISGKKQHDDRNVRPCLDSPQSNSLSDFVRTLIRLRKEHPALQYGSYNKQYLTNTQLIFERNCESERILIALNLEDKTVQIKTTCAGTHAREILSGQSLDTGKGLFLPPRSVSYYLIEA